MKILVAGDFCQHGRVDEAIKQKKYENMFNEEKQIIEQADYSIVNFEFPIVLDTTEAKPIHKCGPNLQGTIETVDVVKYLGFKCCTLANNHILDQGVQCCVDTINELEKAGIDTVGAGKNLEDASNVRYKKIGEETLAIINCCEHEFSIATDTLAGTNPLNPIRQYYKIKEACKKSDYVLVIVHGGHEEFQLPSLRMKEIYHFFVDSGADAVVNHHQHCYSGYEEYKGKPIFYGLGNFLFDSPNHKHSHWNEGYMVRIDFSKDFINYECIPYNQCNEDVTINLMRDSNLENFNKNICHLNEIITNDRCLQIAIDKYYDECVRGEINVMEPYAGKVLNKLYSLHILPSWVKGKKISQILNHVNCEAHRDKLIHALTKLNKK